jgi:hypothetical protein
MPLEGHPANCRAGPCEMCCDCVCSFRDDMDVEEVDVASLANRCSSPIVRGVIWGPPPVIRVGVSTHYRLPPSPERQRPSILRSRGKWRRLPNGAFFVDV